MLEALRHRGPDETGRWVSDDAALGLARLSIIDVQGGQQPVFSSDGGVVAVCNGEIYNFKEIRASLRRGGVSFASGSDAEVIPHLYRRHGLDFVHHLRGMFSIALWDADQGKLVLARDRVGKKPLVYAEKDQCLLFASEARALLAAGWEAKPDLESIDHVLSFAYVAPDNSAFAGVRSLPPGHIGVWQRGHLAVHPYWSWEPRARRTAYTGLGQVLEEALSDAVRVRLVSERPLGAFLSGGIDSTIVTALMTRHHTSAVKTFSIGFTDSRYDESHYARQVAEHLGTDHTELIVEPDPEHMLGRIAEAFDQPFADSSAIPTLLLCDLASRDVVVALSGDGGDEGFGGYDRYVAAPLLQRVNRGLRVLAPLNDRLVSLADGSGRRRLARLTRDLLPRPSLGARYRGLMEYLPLAEREAVWTADARSAFSLSSADAGFDAVWERFSGLEDAARMRATDVVTYLPGDLLTKVDIASMSCSLEVRSPFLDQEVLSLAAGLPRELLIRGTTTKWILRELAYRLVPRNLVDRPKRGFAIPRADWLRGPLNTAARDLLLDRTARERGWFDSSVVERLIVQHESGRDTDALIWPLLMVEVWARRWLDGGRP